MQIPRMPCDAVSLTDAPDAAIVWLLQGGLLPEKAEHVWGMRWHDGIGRLLMPVLDETSRMRGVLGRGVNGEKPKYKAFAGTSTLHFNIRDKDDDRIIVVEDMLSSIAVHAAGFNACCALGTSITPDDARRIWQAGPDRVVGWFDPDAAGDQGWSKFRKRMGLYPTPVSRITSDADPKRLSRDVIREKVNEALRR